MLLSMGNSNPCLSYTQFFTVLSCPQLNKGTENTKETAQNSSSLLCIFPVLVEHHDLIHAEDGTGSGNLSSEVCAQLRRLSVVQDGAGQGHAQRVVPPCKQGEGLGAAQGLPAAPPAPRVLQLQEEGAEKRNLRFSDFNEGLSGNKGPSGGARCVVFVPVGWLRADLWGQTSRFCQLPGLSAPPPAPQPLTSVLLLLLLPRLLRLLLRQLPHALLLQLLQQLQLPPFLLLRLP